MLKNMITSSLVAGALVVGGAAVGPSSASAAQAQATQATQATAPILPPDPARYTQLLVRAWGRGDHPLTAQYATADVVRTLFAFADPGGPSWVFVRCEGALGTQHCLFTDRHRHVELDLDGPTEAFAHPRTHIVDGVRFRRAL
ncbi:MAG: hypothetical protein JWN46_861 [Acidimicrobiales bacterium]|nr:hypothetical protein [Acidimicrobiales bacterium]